MKAEERHELQTNSLALFITRLPDFLRQHSTKVLVIVLIGLLAIIVYRKREQQAISRELEVGEGFSQAQKAVENLPRIIFSSNDPDKVKSALQNTETEINSQLNLVLDDSKDTDHAGRAAAVWMTRGDMYWNIASVLRGPESEEYLARAETAYKKIISDYPNQTMAIRNAHLSLAAIAENRAQWQTAVDEYQHVIESPGLSEVEKFIVNNRLSQVTLLKTPMYLLPAIPPPSTNPTTTSSTDIPSTSILSQLGSGITTAPTTQLTVPTSSPTMPLPATAPTTAPSK